MELSKGCTLLIDYRDLWPQNLVNFYKILMNNG
jgi:hypothetical protein